MSNQFVRAPHIEGSNRSLLSPNSPNAALLIDFDNVTMGMRSDLSKELKSLLNSDIIKGKVTVQRAYADWRRYPQYIVPLSEASIDLIFAPAYGSSKKNATDIRMAIDGMELVFTRPEIGTYILLTGDSDFSSLVLKLKEYGKYVIGVGIQESSSDILVQNCDEYYSYTSISGLRKTTEPGSHSAVDPWVLAEKAVEQMVKRNDVMRSDRLKQVMLEIDSSFDEKSLGFSKFSRFLTEAVSKGVLQLQKMENGQYEIVPKGGSRRSPDSTERSDGRTTSRGRGRDRSRDEGSSRDEGRGREASQPSRSGGAGNDASVSAGVASSAGATASSAGTSEGGREALEPSYQLLLKALGELLVEQSSDSVRDSDVKRRMLALQSGFDESDLGFAKFSLFLRQAHDHGVILLRKGEEGNYHVGPGEGGPASSSASTPRSTSSRSTGSRDRAPRTPSAVPDSDARGSEAQGRNTSGGTASTPGTAPAPGSAPATDTVEVEVEGGEVRRLRPRLAARRRGGDSHPLELFEGQAVSSSAPRKEASAPRTESAPPTEKQGRASTGEAPSGRPSAGSIDPVRLRLPVERESMVLYLTNSYRGVGQKTAETVVDAFGADLFKVLQSDPSRVTALLPPARSEKLLEGWTADFERRLERLASETGSQGSAGEPGGGDGSGVEAESSSRPRARRTRGSGRSAR